MAVCAKTCKVLPEQTVNLVGYECREKDRALCPHYSHVFSQGTNCRLLRKTIDVRAILGIKECKAE